MDRTGVRATDKDLAREHYKPTGAASARSRLAMPLVIFAAGALLVLRLPSLVQPMGADQALYAYIGDRILHGERPYIDAWDQKPPAVHYTYALMRALWPGDGAVAAADLAAAAGTAAFLFLAGRQLASRSVGAGAMLVFLLLSNPAFTRLGGVRIRAQCETFIALLATAALCVLVRRPRTPRTYALAGLLLGCAVVFKYNAIVYAAAAVAVSWACGAMTLRQAGPFVLGLCAPAAAVLAAFAGAWEPLYAATVEYNMRYSGETYAGPLHFVSYLLTFPVDRARDDALWTVGGAGCAALLPLAVRDARRLIPVVWVAAACLTIAINGSRGLPQYFVQAAPALALAAAWSAALIASGVRQRWPSPAGRMVVAAGLALVCVGVWRVNQFPKLVEGTLFDTRYALGRIPADVYLQRYADERKYSAAAAADLARLARVHSAPAESIYVFGFTAAAYVYADRASASRFFWSRPVIAGFKSGTPGYGVGGLLAELHAARPALVALQIHDWAPDVDDSATFFMSTPQLADWLRSRYAPVAGPEDFHVWVRRD